MLQEQELKTFVEGTTNYFEIAAQQPASIGSPYLVTKGKPGVHGYTGVIKISGKREGIVYFTRAPDDADRAAHEDAGDATSATRRSATWSARWRTRSPATRAGTSGGTSSSPCRVS